MSFINSHRHCPKISVLFTILDSSQPVLSSLHCDFITISYMYGLVNHASAYSCNRNRAWTALSAEAFDKWQSILDLGNMY